MTTCYFHDHHIGIGRCSFHHRDDTKYYYDALYSIIDDDCLLQTMTTTTLLYSLGHLSSNVFQNYDDVYEIKLWRIGAYTIKSVA